MSLPRNEFEQRLHVLQGIPAQRTSVPKMPPQKQSLAPQSVCPQTMLMPTPVMRMAAPPIPPKPVQAEPIAPRPIPAQATPPTIPSPSTPSATLRRSLEERIEQALPLKEQLDRLCNWRARWMPDSNRVLSAGRLLFQLIGAAGYAGYFASMHTLMRVVSGTLMAGSWYAIYRIKGLRP